MGTAVTEKYTLFAQRVRPLLSIVYPAEILDDLTEKLFSQVVPFLQQGSRENLRKWDHNNVLLITYGDSVVSTDGRPPLAVLAEFLETHLKDTITGVHVLPFFPYSSDDGFAIIDYTQVNPELGNWSHIKRIAQNFNLMVDLVINHVSSDHAWVKQFQAAEKPGCDYLIETDPDQDLSDVVRPRSSSLLTKLDTVAGAKYVWSTFSADQIDVNFSNPDVLLEYVKIILLYVEVGARYLRLDAVGYLWKKLGTPCIHLAENPCDRAVDAGNLANAGSRHCHHYRNQCPQPGEPELFRQPQRSPHDLQLQPAAAVVECSDAGQVRAPQNLDDEYAARSYRLRLL
jgi:sucrose phosphorylase